MHKKNKDTFVNKHNTHNMKQTHQIKYGTEKAL